jgi:hypothetical protein
MTIHGWDMSHFDAVSIGSAVSEGISFVTHKAGGDKRDDEFGAWWNGVKNIPDPYWDEATQSVKGLLKGAYWVLYPGRPVGRANDFIADLDARAPGWRDGPFILQVDCEKWNNDPSTVPSPTDIGAFCDRLMTLAPKLQPIGYVPEWVYGDTLTGLRCPLWASRYVTGSGSFRSLYPGDSSGKWSAYSGQTPAILQYTSSATIGGQTTCDANAFRGTMVELMALLTPGWEIEMPITTAEFNRIQSGVDSRVGDVVQRYVPGTDAAVAATDPNPKMTAASALAYVARDTAVLRAQLTALAAAQSARDAAEIDRDAASAARDAALVGKLDAMPAAVRVELESIGGTDGVAIEAAVRRALASLRLIVEPTLSPSAP